MKRTFIATWVPMVVLAIGILLIGQTASAAPIVYNGSIPVPGTVSGDSPLNAIFDSTLWDYWSFTLAVASTVTIDGHRTTSEMDPAMNLYAGTGGDSAGMGLCGPDNGVIVFLACADDNNGIPHGVGGSYADPRIVIALGAGTYTIAIFDYLGAGPEPKYELHLSGVPVVPEPATLLLLGSGLAAIGGLGWRRRK